MTALQSQQYGRCSHSSMKALQSQCCVSGGHSSLKALLLALLDFILRSKKGPEAPENLRAAKTVRTVIMVLMRL